MESIPNILLIILGILIAPLALLFGGICVLYLTGCCIAGSGRDGFERYVSQQIIA